MLPLSQAASLVKVLLDAVLYLLALKRRKIFERPTARPPARGSVLLWLRRLLADEVERVVGVVAVRRAAALVDLRRLRAGALVRPLWGAAGAATRRALARDGRLCGAGFDRRAVVLGDALPRLDGAATAVVAQCHGQRNAAEDASDDVEQYASHVPSGRVSVPLLETSTRKL